MAFAQVNGKPVHPPYQPHTRVSSYNFHASLKNYTFVGGGGGTIATGDRVTFHWLIQGTSPNLKAIRFVTCTVPEPGRS